MLNRLLNLFKPKNAATNLQELQAEQGKRLRFEMSASAIKVDIIGDIDAWWGFGVRELNYQLAQSPNKPVEVFIHSGGGDLLEGIAIANTLRSHAGTVTTIGVGMVGSAATVIHAAADKGKALLMEGTTYMIHEVSAGTWGRSQDLRKTADLIEQFNDVVADMYTGKVNDTLPNAKDEIRLLMAEETYMTAEQAIQLGFADGLYNTTKISNSMKEQTPLDMLLAKAQALNATNQAEEVEPNGSPAEVVEVVEDVPVLDESVVELQAANTALIDALTNVVETLNSVSARLTSLEKARNLGASAKIVEQPKAATPLEKAQNILNAAIAAKNNK